MVLAALVALALASAPGLGQPTSRELRERLVSVYLELLEVEELGYNVSGQVEMLNQALSLIRSYESGKGSAEDLLKAQEILDELEGEMPALRAEAEREKSLRDFLTALTVALIVSFVGIFAVLVPRIAWRLWYRLRRDWVVRPV